MNKDIIYQSERYFPNNVNRSVASGYQIPLPNGSYSVVLGFSEIYDEFRSINVSLESQRVMEKYDPADHKFATAEEKEFEIEVNARLPRRWTNDDPR